MHTLGLVRDRVRRASPDLDPLPQLVGLAQQPGYGVLIFDGIGDTVAMPTPEPLASKQDCHAPAASRAQEPGPRPAVVAGGPVQVHLLAGPGRSGR